MTKAQMTNDQKPDEQGLTNGRQRLKRKLRRWLVVLAVIGLPLMIGGAIYIHKKPCPYRGAPVEIRRIALGGTYPTETRYRLLVQGSTTTCALCELDSWLCPVDGCHRIDFLYTVINPERHETYYVFVFHHSVDAYLVYIVKDGFLMPQSKFEDGGA